MSDAQANLLKANADFALARKAHDAGRLVEAAQGYERALANNPNHAPALHNLGLILLGRGEADAALGKILQAVGLNPRFSAFHNSLGNAYRQLGQLEKAEAAYRKSIELDPNYAAPHYNLGLTFAESGRSAEAESHYRNAVAIDPRYLKALINLGNMLRERDPDAAIAFMGRALEVDPKNALAHNNLGNFLRDLDRLEEAAESYQKAITLDSNFAPAWLNLGTVLSQLGQTARSVETLRQTIKLKPERGEPYFQLAITTKLKLDDPATTAMRRLYEDPATPAQERMYLAFGLGRVFDENWMFDEAFACWTVGNRLNRSTATYSMAAQEKIIADMRKLFSPAFLASQPQSSITDDTPIFVVGMIRSGTTLMEQILASHPQVVGADENTWVSQAIRGLRNFTRAELDRVGQSYLDRLRERFGPGPRFIVDKLVGNWLFAGYLHLMLPKAKIICMRRNPYDSGLSAFSSLFTAYHEYCYDLEDIARFTNLFRKMMEHWETVLPGKILQIQYETLIAEPETTVRGVLDHVGLSFDARCLNFHQTERRVRTASTQQVREKLHSRSVARWRNYEKYLGVWEPYFGKPE